MRHAFLVALSFANICYLRVWAELLTYRPWDTYLMTTPPRPVEYLALVCNIVLMAALLTGLSFLARRLLPGKRFRFAEMAVVLGIFIPLNALRAVLSNQFPLLKSPLIELLGLRGVMILGVLPRDCRADRGCVLSSQGGSGDHRDTGRPQPVLRGHLRTGSVEGRAL